MDILKQFPGRYLSVADLEEMGGEVSGAINKIVLEDMKNNAGANETKPVLYLEGRSQGLVVNKSNAISLAEKLGRNTDQWTGKRIVIRLEQWGPAVQRKKWLACYLEDAFEVEHRPPSIKEAARTAQAPLDDLLDDDISDI